jgi:predicted exporter
MRSVSRWGWLLAIPIILGLWRLHLDADVLNLLPSEIPAVRGLQLHQESFANDRELLLTVDAASSEAAQEAARLLAATLRPATHLVDTVVWQPPWLDHPGDTAEFMAWLWLNQPPEGVTELATRLSPSNLPRTLALVRDQLATSFSPLELARLSYDPLGLSVLPDGLGGSEATDPTQGTGLFSSEDGRFRILFVRPREGLAGFGSAGDWLRSVKVLIQRAQTDPAWPEGTQVGCTGKPAFLAEAAEGMERDMRTSMLGTLGLIALLFWLAHRRWAPLLWLLLMLQLVLLTTAALGGLVLGTLNLVSFGFAAILMGLSVDYALVLYQEAASGRAQTAGEVRRQMARAIWGSALTTSAAFALLNLGGLPGLGQLGSLVAMGVLVAAVVMLHAFLPLALRNLPAEEGVPGRRTPERRRPDGAGLARAATVALLVFGGFVLAGAFPAVDRSTQPLSPRNSAAEAAARQIGEKLGNPGDPVWALVQGDSVTEVRNRLQKLQTAIDAARREAPDLTAELPLPLWPQASNQVVNLPVLAELGREAPRVETALTTAGFTSDAAGLMQQVLAGWRTLRPEQLPLWPAGDSGRWLVERFAARIPDGWLALGVIHPGTDGLPAIADGDLPGVTLCGWQLLGEELLTHVEARTGWLVAGLLAALGLGLRTTYGSWRPVFLSLLAVAFAIGLLLVVMALLGWSWNLMNLPALPLLLGAGIDYSIHVQLSLRRHHGDVQEMRRSTGRALWLCAGTTVVAFGSLAASSNAGLASLGRVCAAGVLCMLLTKLYLLPAWLYRPVRRGPQPD